MTDDTNRPVDLWTVDLALGKKINELICLKNDCKKDEHKRLEILFQAWELIPKPATQFYTPTGAVAIGISDCYFKLGELDKALEWALVAFEVRKNRMDVLYPLTVGQIYYELGDLKNAYTYFDMVYELDRYSPFAGEDKKYWQFYKAEKEKIKLQEKERKKKEKAQEKEKKKK